MEKQTSTRFCNASAKNGAGADQSGVLDALYKRAVGCSADEIVEEYTVAEDGSE